MILVPFESAYATSYQSFVVTLVVSCTVSEIQRHWLKSENRVFFLSFSYSAPPLPMFPLEFCAEVNHEETRVMGLLCGESCMILTSTVFDRVTDKRMGDSIWRAALQHAVAYMLLHANKIELNCNQQFY